MRWTREKTKNEQEWTLIVLMSRIFGYYDSVLRWKEKQWIATELCTKMVHNHGFSILICHRSKHASEVGLATEILIG